jgi:protein-L-isoaspartate(D-aspartate) O-methyltransferase
VTGPIWRAEDLARRDRMIARQLRARGLADERVIAAIAAVPRHLFVPPDLAWAAYEDRPLAIGEGQTISQPYMVAVMTAVLAARDEDRILEVGTGSGYQAAVLAHLARRVFTIERHPRLASGAARRLRTLGLVNAHVIVSDGTRGLPRGAPYSRILITAAAPSVPPPLIDQLADDGRLVAPIGTADFQRLTIVRRAGAEIASEAGEACVFVPLVGEYGWKP